ncbi:glucosaminidase domain-containing protein [Bacillus sp. J33]|uniref:glucosaminidase domain-containing protein n=1 Tax=Bacillus sp. J33 TaxID=935836 RepID=UPI00047BA258
MHETDYLRFNGVVQPEQNSFCGLGATDPDNPGTNFETPSQGMLAQLQHLNAYASANHNLMNIYARFDLVESGLLLPHLAWSPLL